jgi:hypothetical protein
VRRLRADFTFERFWLLIVLSFGVTSLFLPPSLLYSRDSLVSRVCDRLLIMRFFSLLFVSLISELGEARRDPRHAGRAIAEKIELAEREFHHVPVEPLRTSKVQSVKRANGTLIPQTEGIKSMATYGIGSTRELTCRRIHCQWRQDTGCRL